MPEQLRLQKVHQAVTLSELRAFILCLKSGKDNQKEVATGIMHLEEYILASKLGFQKTNDIFRACDPPEHVRGKCKVSSHLGTHSEPFQGKPLESYWASFKV